MTKPFFSFIFLLCGASMCLAQQPEKIEKNHYEFAPGEKVIFEDNFSTDKPGAFPSKWHIGGCNNFNEPDYYNKTFWKIEKDGDEHLLVISATKRPIGPIIRSQNYLPDSFTVEFDFTLNGHDACAELYFKPKGSSDTCNEITFHLPIIGKIFFSSPAALPPMIEAAFTYPLNNRSWHHFALAYNKRAVDVYLNKYRILSIPDCKFSAESVSLGCIAQVKYKHFKITTGKDDNTFARLLTGRKFVTHAINFEVNSSTIKPESMPFIVQLAQFLKTNPTMKLEIDGHTDSDGNAVTNRKLSNERADEVKRQLVSAGIDSKRLTTKGFGASKPLATNTTAEGKASNRRVEFIRK